MLPDDKEGKVGKGWVVERKLALVEPAGVVVDGARAAAAEASRLRPPSFVEALKMGSVPGWGREREYCKGY